MNTAKHLVCAVGVASCLFAHAVEKDAPEGGRLCASLAAKYGYKGACANKIDFGDFRREVEALVNARSRQ